MLSPGSVAKIGRAAVGKERGRGRLPGVSTNATVTLPVKHAAVLPRASSAVRCTAVAGAAPATVSLCWTLKLSCVAAPAVMLNGVDVVPLRLPLLAVSV